MSFINGSSVKNPIETGSLANTVIRKLTGLFKPVNMFHLSLLSVGLTQALNSLRSWKKSDHNAVKFSYELNFRHSQFTSYLFTKSQPRTCKFHASRNTLQSRFTEQFFIKSRFTEHKKNRITASRNYPCPPSLYHMVDQNQKKLSSSLTLSVYDLIC